MANHTVIPESRTCPVCSTTFEVGGRGRRQRKSIYCSRHCAMVMGHRTRTVYHGSHAPRPKKNHDTLHNEAWLRTKYLDEKLSSPDLARMLGCATPSVLHALAKFGIPVRSTSEAKRGRLLKAFVSAGDGSSVDRARTRDYQSNLALKAEFVAAYGGRCGCCGETEPIFLTLEHMHGGGLAERRTIGSAGILRRLRAEGWPQGDYRVLCMNCNIATKFARTCPHQITVS